VLPRRRGARRRRRAACRPAAQLPLDVLKPPVVVSPVAAVVPCVAVMVPRCRAARCRRCIARRPAASEEPIVDLATFILTIDTLKVFLYKYNVT